MYVLDSNVYLAFISSVINDLLAFGDCKDSLIKELQVVCIVGL